MICIIEKSNLFFDLFCIGFKGIIVAKKNDGNAPTLSDSQRFMTSLGHRESTNSLLTALQKNVFSLPVEIHIQEVFTQLKFITNSPLVNLQIQRFAQVIDLDNSLQQNLNEFEQMVLDIIRVSAESRLLLDPNCKSEQTFSSVILEYKKWLSKILFILLCCNPEKYTISEAVVDGLLQYLNQIYSAVCISRIKLRKSANIQSDVLYEIPRNTVVQVFGHDIQQHWVKIALYVAEQKYEGYVQRVYLKS